VCYCVDSDVVCYRVDSEVVGGVVAVVGHH